eukprot:1066017-Pelagomonas_calceolata.AAC.8
MSWESLYHGLGCTCAQLQFVTCVLPDSGIRIKCFAAAELPIPLRNCILSVHAGGAFVYADIMQADLLPEEGMPLLTRVLERLKLIRLGECVLGGSSP